jgi:ribosomal protein S18 acetylase RimI-like enzyme
MRTAALTIREAGLNDLQTVESLAQEIWPGTYGQIISADQLSYMLQLIYSQSSLQRQMLQEHHQFLIAELDGKPIGFADYSLYEPGIYKLHKIYVHASTQGKGVGKALIDHIIGKLSELKAHTLLLNVNRYNKARLFYEKLGFAVKKEEDIDIGNGYFMNDYVMKKELEIKNEK